MQSRERARARGWRILSLAQSESAHSQQQATRLRYTLTRPENNETRKFRVDEFSAAHVNAAE
jgi:hypothetical protein